MPSTPAGKAAQAKGKQKPPKLYAEEDREQIQRLSLHSLPSWSARSESKTIRPERPEFHSDFSRQKWDQTLRTIRANIDTGGFHFSKYLDGFHADDPRFRAVTIILFDEVCRPRAPPELRTCRIPDYKRVQKRAKRAWEPIPTGSMGLIPAIIEHMLLVDYGLQTPGIGKVSDSQWKFMWWEFIRMCDDIITLARSYRHNVSPSAETSRARDAIATVTWRAIARSCSDLDVADVALMLFYFRTRHDLLATVKYYYGRTGYTGIFAEMVRDCRRGGADARLRRKLSVDFNELIPKVVSDSAVRAELLVRAQGFARRFGMELSARPQGQPKVVHKGQSDGVDAWLDGLGDGVELIPDVSDPGIEAGENGIEWELVWDDCDEWEELSAAELDNSF